MGRVYYLDYLRVCSIICIIAIHTTAAIAESEKFSEQWWFWAISQNFIRYGLPIFFMISGALLLNGKDESLLTFYRKKMIQILVPFIVFSLFYVYWSNIELEWHSASDFKDSILLIISGPVFYHLWFVYTLIGLYLATPFLKILMKNASDKALMNLIVLLLLYNGAKVYLPLLGVNIGIDNFAFEGWVVYFLLGYLLTKDLSRKITNIIYISGIVSFVMTMLILIYWDAGSANLFDYSPLMILICASIFVYFKNGNSFFSIKKPLYPMVSSVVKYGFSIYLIHAYVLSAIVFEKLEIYPFSYNYIGGTVLVILCTLIISYLISVIVDNLIINNIVSVINFTLKLITKK